jgi:RHH-type transcriptional regulator, rel operon repressor / antitoxin RelB
MTTTTFSVRVGRSTKSRLEKLAKSTGRSRSFLAAEAISAYLDTNEWQVAGITTALSSLDRGMSMAHSRVSEWVNFLGDLPRAPRAQEGMTLQWSTAPHEGRRNRRSHRDAAAGSTRPLPPLGLRHSRPAAATTPRSSTPLRLNSAALPDGR